MTTQYIRLSDNMFPLYEGDIRLSHPEITEDQTYPNFPCPPEYALVEIDPEPMYDPMEYTTSLLPPKCVNGVWRCDWSPVTELSPEIKAAKKIAQEAHIASIRTPQSNMLYQNLDAPGGVPNVIG
jgi:hypothetical protein